MTMRLFSLVFLLAAVFGARSANAQEWPGRPINLVVGYAAGGSTDIVARMIAGPLGTRLNGTVVVENKAGAGGTIGAVAVARSLPDGYTLLFSASPELAIAPALGKAQGYDPKKAFQPIALICVVPQILVVNSAVPAQSVKELIKLAKSKPGTLNMSSYGNGTSNHLTGELFKAVEGLDIVHIPFSGSAPGMTELLAGRVQMTFDTEAVIGTHLATGKLRALAIASLKRSPTLPNLPTMDEEGVKGVVGGSWVGVLAPSGTPPAVVEKIGSALVSVMSSQEMRNALAARGFNDCGASTPQAFAEFINKDIDKWTGVAKRAKLVAE